MPSSCSPSASLKAARAIVHPVFLFPHGCHLDAPAGGHLLLYSPSAFLKSMGTIFSFFFFFFFLPFLFFLLIYLFIFTSSLTLFGKCHLCTALSLTIASGHHLHALLLLSSRVPVFLRGEYLCMSGAPVSWPPLRGHPLTPWI